MISLHNDLTGVEPVFAAHLAADTANPSLRRSRRGTLWLGLALTLLASACAPLQTATNAAGQPAASAVAAAAPAVVPPPAPKLPLLSLTQDILYQLMMSEIAAQRSLPGPAFNTLYELAQRTRDPRIARRSLELALQARQPGNALLGARLWNELADSVQSKEALFNMLVLAGQFEEVETLLRRDLASMAAPELAFGSIGTLLARSTRRSEALTVMEDLAADYPKLPEAKLAVAQSAQLAGNKARAIEKVREALALRPDWELAALIGAQYLQPESPTAASEFLNQFLVNAPNSSSARLALGRVLAGDQRYAEAMVQFRRVLEQQADNSEANYAMGLLAKQSGKMDEAERFFKRYIELAAKARPDERNTNRANLQLAQIEEDRKNIEAALSYLARVTDGEEALPALGRRAALLASAKRLDEARKLLREADASSARERVQLVQMEAQLLRDNNRVDEALAFLTDAIKTYPDEPDLLYDQAMVAEKLNKLELMESALRELIRQRPDSAQAYNALGYSLADRKLRLDEAFKLIERALTLAPDDAAITDSMGWVHYRLGNNDKALEFLRRAYAMRPDTEVGAHLGEVLWVTGKQSEAQQLWREARQKEPENEVLRETVTRLNVPPTAR